jgi:hypothetical protein
MFCLTVDPHQLTQTLDFLPGASLASSANRLSHHNGLTQSDVPFLTLYVTMTTAFIVCSEMLIVSRMNSQPDLNRITTSIVRIA